MSLLATPSIFRREGAGRQARVTGLPPVACTPLLGTPLVKQINPSQTGTHSRISQDRAMIIVLSQYGELARRNSMHFRLLDESVTIRYETIGMAMIPSKE
jgi:hypothetical protein